MSVAASTVKLLVEVIVSASIVVLSTTTPALAVTTPTAANVLSKVAAPVTSRVPAKSTLAPLKVAAKVLPDFNCKLPLLLVKLAY